MAELGEETLGMLVAIFCLLFAIFLKIIGVSTRQAVIRAVLLFVLLEYFFVRMFFPH